MTRIKIKKIILRGDEMSGIPLERLRMAIEAGLAGHDYPQRPRPRDVSRQWLQIGPTPKPEQLGRMIADRIRRVLKE
jgi:hypothetical protein